MIAAVASENGAPHDYASDTPSSVSWQRFSADDGLGTYELVTRTLATSAASEVSLVRNGHRVKVVYIFVLFNFIYMEPLVAMVKALTQIFPHGHGITKYEKYPSDSRYTAPKLRVLFDRLSGRTSTLTRGGRMSCSSIRTIQVMM